MGRTLIVGGGVTGAAVARLLQEAKQPAADVVVWERNSIVGGRVMARSFPKQRDVHVDMGAQYWTPKSELNDDWRRELLQRGHLTTFAQSQIAQDPFRSSATTHYVSPESKGFQAVVEHLLEGTTTLLSSQLEKFEVLDDKRVKVVTNEGKEDVVSELVLTCPIPNVLAILKKSKTFQVDPETTRALEGVTYSQRFAAAYVFDETFAPQVQAFGWTAKYIPYDESDIIRFVCWDHLKKQQQQSQPTLIVHTSVAFGSTFMDDTCHDDEILASITKSLRQLIPALPAEEDARLHRWRISQVSAPYRSPHNTTDDEDAPAALVLSSHPRILVAGDSFLGSGIDNCLLSATAAVKLLQDPDSAL